MAKKTGKRGRRRRKQRPTPSIGPTPETQGKLRPDNLLYLYKRGSINQAQRDAALEIRGMQEALIIRFFRSANMEGIRGGTPNPHPLDGLIPELVSRFHKKYSPWRELMQKCRYGGVPLLPLCTDIILEGHGLADLDAHHKVKRHTCRQAFRWAMDEYGTVR